MLMQLIRKDILLAKKYVIILIVFIVAMQVLPMIFSAESAIQSGSFMMGLIFGQLLFFTTLSQLESKYTKATALLCAAPYTRNTFVHAKYVLLLLLFVFSLIVNIIITLVTDATTLIPPTIILATLLIDIIIFGIYIPLELKFGFTKVRFIYMAVILVAAFLPQMFMRLFFAMDPRTQTIDTGIINRVFSVVQSIPEVAWCVIMVLVTVAVFCLSLRKSIKIFNSKEL